eukprot:355368-Chlamydomonas_euryale.AAC.22
MRNMHANAIAAASGNHYVAHSAVPAATVDAPSLYHTCRHTIGMRYAFALLMHSVLRHFLGCQRMDAAA